MTTSENPYESSRIVIRPEEVNRPRQPQGSPTQESVVQLFRVFIVADIALMFLVVLLSFVGEAIYGVGQADAQADEEVSLGLALLGISLIIAVLAFLVAQIVAWIGLLRFSPWSRWLYLGIVVVNYLLLLPIGAFDFSPTWGLSAGISEIESVISGVILAMAFFSPAAERFVERKNGPSR